MQKTTPVKKITEIGNTEDEMGPSQKTLNSIVQFAAAFQTQKISENTFVNMIMN